jgi:hypothetical protein
LSGRDPHAPATERYLLERTMAARTTLLS